MTEAGTGGNSLVVTVSNSNRSKLFAQRDKYTTKLAQIDRALQLLDANPAIEELADLLKEALSDHDY